MANGINVYLVDMPESDPSEIGFERIHQILDSTYRLSEEQLMQEKLLCRL